MDAQLAVSIIFGWLLLSLIGLSCYFVTVGDGHLRLSHGAVMTLGAYFAHTAWRLADGQTALVLALGALSGGIAGLLFEVTVLCRLRRGSAKGWQVLLASLGLFVVLENTIALVFGDDTQTFNSTTVRIGQPIFGAYVTRVQWLILGVSVFCCILAVLVFRYTRVGRAIRGVSSNAELAGILGINSERFILLAVTIGSAIGALGGTLAGLDTNMTPTMGFHLMIGGFVVMILGGTGSVGGLVAAGLLIALTQNLSAFYLNGKWTEAMEFLILIAFLIWRPLGFGGRRLKKVEI